MLRGGYTTDCQRESSRGAPARPLPDPRAALAAVLVSASSAAGSQLLGGEGVFHKGSSGSRRSKLLVALKLAGRGRRRQARREGWSLSLAADRGSEVWKARFSPKPPDSRQLRLQLWTPAAPPRRPMDWEPEHAFGPCGRSRRRGGLPLIPPGRERKCDHCPGSHSLVFLATLSFGGRLWGRQFQKQHQITEKAL